MLEQYIHSHEVGRRGKPDELDSQIAMLLGAEVLRRDEGARFDIRVAGSFDIQRNHPIVLITGEVSDRVLYQTDFPHTVAKIVAEHYQYIVKQDFDPARVTLQCKPQSKHLAQNSGDTGKMQSSSEVGGSPQGVGVNREPRLSAGDIGTCIAVAYADTPNHLPWERFLSVELRDTIDAIYFQQELPSYIFGTDLKRHHLKSDGKIEVLARYEWADLVHLEAVTLCIEHQDDVDFSVFTQQVEELVVQTLNYYSREYRVHFDHPRIIVNPSGPWTTWGRKTDAGTREAKPQRDAFGSYGLCEDAMCGEDGTKPGVSGTLMARKIATWLVKNDYAKFARVVLCRQTGLIDPIINITTQGTADKSQEELEKMVHEYFNLSFPKVVAGLKIADPKVYEWVAEDSDWFQRADWEWNK